MAAAVAAATTLVVLAAAVAGWRTFGGNPARVGTTSDGDSTIVAVGNELWVASPDDESIGIVDPASGESVDRVTLEAAPMRLLAVDSTVLASLRGTRAIVAVETRGRSRSVATINVPCTPAGALADLESDRATRVAVACADTAELAVVDVATGAAVAIPAQPRIEALAVATNRLFAIGVNGSTVSWPLAPLVDGRLDEAADAAPRREDPMWSFDGRSTSLVAGASDSPDGLIAAYQASDNERAADPLDPADSGSYGSPVDGRARIEPVVSGWCPHFLSDWKRPQTSVAGPADLVVDAEHERLWVVGRLSGSVSVYDCSEGAGAGGRARVIAGFDVGVGAQGLVLDNDGAGAWVDAAFDHALAHVDLPPDGRAVVGLSPTRTIRRELGPSTLSADAEEGRRAFHDATNRHLTPQRIAACASCHPDGGDDGLAWRISTATIDTKYRRTPALWALAGDDTTLHWDAQFGSVEELSVSTIHELLGGDALLVEPASIAAYLRELEAPLAPATTSEAASRGERLFGELGCRSCHAGEQGSDGRVHAGTVSASVEANGELESAATPRLVGLGRRQPYLHDGRAASLADVLGENDGGVHDISGSVGSAEVDALIAYLATR